MFKYKQHCSDWNALTNTPSEIFFHTRETTHTHFFLGPDSDDTQLETFFFTQETTHLFAGPDNDVLHDIV